MKRVRQLQKMQDCNLNESKLSIKTMPLLKKSTTWYFLNINQQLLQKKRIEPLSLILKMNFNMGFCELLMTDLFQKKWEKLEVLWRQEALFLFLEIGRASCRERV